MSSPQRVRVTSPRICGRVAWALVLTLGGAATAPAALVTQTIGGGVNDGSSGLPAFSTVVPNPLGLTNSSAISGFVSYDDSLIPGGSGDQRLAWDGTNFDFMVNVGGYSVGPGDDSFGPVDDLPQLIFNNGQVVGIDFLQDNTNGMPVACSGSFAGPNGPIDVGWCELGMGPGAQFGTGAPGDPTANPNPFPNLLSFEYVQPMPGGNNIEVKFFEGLMTFSHPTTPNSEVPEPGTFVLLGSALLFGSRFARRRMD